MSYVLGHDKAIYPELLFFTHILRRITIGIFTVALEFWKGMKNAVE
jgi:hypothetical protein